MNPSRTKSATLVTVDDKLRRMMTRTHADDPLRNSIRSARSDVQAALELVAEYRSA